MSPHVKPLPAIAAGSGPFVVEHCSPDEGGRSAEPSEASAGLFVAPLDADDLHLDGLAHGRLDQRLDVDSKDEVGHMASALNKAMAHLRQTMTTIGSNAQSLAASSEELSAVSGQMSGSAEESASQANLVSAAAEQVSRNVQTVATGTEEMSASIREIAKSALREPVEVTVGDAAPQATIEQRFVEVEPARKPAALAGLLLEHRPASCVVFCNMRKDTEEVVSSLAHLGFSALALHGDMEQRDREEVLVRFANRSCNVLVASDVAARGLDIEDLAAVINYDVPSDADTYVHRVGRTGRAGRTGLAFTLCTSRELPRTRLIEERIGEALRWDKPLLAALRPGSAPAASTVTLRIDAGKTDKLRPGDIVGALTGDAGLAGDAVGKIDVFPTRSYVAIARSQAERALARLQAGKIKGRKFRVRRI